MTKTATALLTTVLLALPTQHCEWALLQMAQSESIELRLAYTTSPNITSDIDHYAEKYIQERPWRHRDLADGPRARHHPALGSASWLSARRCSLAYVLACYAHILWGHFLP